MDIQQKSSAFFVSLTCICALLYRRSACLDTTGRKIEYVFYTSRLGWNEAREVCHSIGGDLAKVDSSDTLYVIYDQYWTYRYQTGDYYLSLNDFWTGLYYNTSFERTLAIDCSPFTDTSILNENEQYNSNNLCFKMMETGRYGGNRKHFSVPCGDSTAFLCEIHPGGICNFRPKMSDKRVSSVNCFHDYSACENHCAYDATCSDALFVSPSICYTLAYSTKNVTIQGLATQGYKVCASFTKNDTQFTPGSSIQQSPVDNCGVIPTFGPPNNSSNISTTCADGPFSTSATSQSVPTATVTVTLAHVTTTTSPAPPCTCTACTACTACTVTATSTATLTEVQMTTIQPSASPSIYMTSQETTPIQTATAPMTPCLHIAPPNITTITLTQAATTTLTPCMHTTSPEIATTMVTQTTTLTSYMNTMSSEITTTTVTATPSCSLPSIPVTPYGTPPPPPSPNENMTTHKAEQIAEEISKNLTINARKTSSYVRSLISAPDDRKSSVAIGTVGMACIAVPLALIMSTDFLRVYAFVRSLLAKV